MRVTILGCGSSGGVPRIGNHWGRCDPNEPRNRRRRCSILVERDGPDGTTRVLVDTSPDLREQLLDAGVGRLDAVLYTHDHADQVHGIDDLRMVATNMRARVDVFADDATAATLSRRFDYCFVQPEGSPYPAILNLHRLPDCGDSLTIDGPGGTIAVVPFWQDHGPTHSLGFHFGTFAYSSDLVGLNEESFGILDGVDTWIVDCLRDTPHPTHAHYELTMSWIARVRPRRAVLTNLHFDLDYGELSRRVPSGVVVAHDGLVLEWPRDS